MTACVIGCLLGLAGSQNECFDFEMVGNSIELPYNCSVVEIVVVEVYSGNTLIWASASSFAMG
jgi:hypothetical protein